MTASGHHGRRRGCRCCPGRRPRRHRRLAGSPPPRPARARHRDPTSPELFSPVKWVVGQSDDKDPIVLTGSQTYHLMKGASESLPGRARMLEIPGLSLRELLGDAAQPTPHIPAPQQALAPHWEGGTWEVIRSGLMPALQDPDIDWGFRHSNHVATHLERNAHELPNIKDQAKLYGFMVARAARSGQLLNVTDIANVSGATAKTVTT